jgi:hypothetical protein
MAWFIIEYERKTWTKYLVQADSETEYLNQPCKVGNAHQDKFLS